MIIDSHCHLDRLKTEHYTNGLDGAIEAAKEAGISAMLCVCISEDNKQDVLDIADRYPSIFASVGVHPCDISEVVSVDRLKEWSHGEKIVALGETGLDYHYSAEKAAEQQQSFANHLIAGAELGLPVIVHTREAQQDTLNLIKVHGSEEYSGVLHCFTETWDMARMALDMNYYISFSGIVTFKNAEQLRDVAKRVPAERLLVETDSPYLAPVPFRGKPNEPKYVRHVAEYIADLRGISYQTLADVTNENFYRLFRRAALLS